MPAKKKPVTKVAKKVDAPAEPKREVKNYIILNRNTMHNGVVYKKDTKIYTINPDYQVFKAVNERV